MKVLFISNDPQLFDAQSAVHARMQSYANAIGELHILSQGKKGAVEMHRGSLHVYPVFCSKFFRVRVLAQKARALIEAKGIEVVSAQDPFEHGLAALRAVTGTSARLHIQIHTDFLSPYFAKESVKNFIRVRIADRVLPKAHGIRVVSKRIGDGLKTHYGTRIGEPTILPIAVPAVLPPRAALPPHSFTFSLVTISRLEKEKRLEDILDALALLGETYRMVGLFVIGEGSEREKLERRVEALGLKDRVLFLGWRTDALALAQSASAYIQASAYEGYGRTLIEAALARLPLITTDVGIVGEVFIDGISALVAPVASPKVLAAQITKLIEDTELRAHLVIQAEMEAKKHLENEADAAMHVAADLHRLAPFSQL